MRNDPDLTDVRPQHPGALGPDDLHLLVPGTVIGRIDTRFHGIQKFKIERGVEGKGSARYVTVTEVGNSSSPKTIFLTDAGILPYEAGLWHRIHYTVMAS